MQGVGGKEIITTAGCSLVGQPHSHTCASEAVPRDYAGWMPRVVVCVFSPRPPRG